MRNMLWLCIFMCCIGAEQTKYKLLRCLEVDGRQGVATDGQHYFVSGSKSLYKYDKNGKLVAKNTTPFASYKIPCNHIGDIDVFHGELFISAEYFMDGKGKDIQIAIHDAKTLKFKRTFKFDASSGQEEVSGICVDRDRKTVWMCSWVGGESGNHIYEYDLTTGNYLRKVRLNPAPQWQQGIFYYKGNLYLSADDGDAEKQQWDHLYRVVLHKNNTASVTMEKTFDDIKFPGEAEGLAVDPTTNELLMHFNRGKRIVLGMPKGFYPGYTREIHEIYVYKIIKTP
ncbi:hypothetical protein [Candidatus Uabimicrobium amorphum]|uniref:Uncharacterized protein n=2 Tax=Uabimicrobium amorphum TaxID=2596890 RepID=A0A5S9ISQ0_UABAM|nr:hypothetical protein UABAM_04331 [Candidatus Uabimicrobium amorphum]